MSDAPRPPRTRPDRERLFTGELLRLGRIYRREVNRQIARLGLSDARALPVLHIARAGNGLRQGTLADELGIEGPSLVRQLDQLCAAGLIERRDDPHDRRAKTLHLTADGVALAARLEDLLRGVRAELLAHVTDADLAATLRTLGSFEAALAARDPRAHDPKSS